jgi:hypothetical protein
MCKSLDAFEPREVLDLLVTHSRRDVIVNELLIRVPSVVALGEFLSRIPIQKVNKRAFKRLERSGCLI